MKYGSVVDSDYMKQAGVKNASIDELAKEAFRSAGGIADVDCVTRVNGMKEEYGSGVSTLLTIYNALGCELHLKDSRDWSGHLFKYTYDDVIYNGEWSCVLHTKTAGSATDSAGAVVYELRGGYGSQDVLVITWRTRFTGSNVANCYCMNINTFNATGWDTIATWADNGFAHKDHDLGVLRVRATVSSATSPILRVVASQSALF